MQAKEAQPDTGLSPPCACELLGTTHLVRMGGTRTWGAGTHRFVDVGMQLHCLLAIGGLDCALICTLGHIENLVEALCTQDEVHKGSADDGWIEEADVAWCERGENECLLTPGMTTNAPSPSLML